MVLGTLDSASARKKSSSQAAGDRQREMASSRAGQLVPVDRDGTPIIMQGYRSPSMMRRDKGLEPIQPMQRADRPIRIPRGSSTYIPPPNPTPYSSSNSNPPAALTQLPPAPYQPAPITTFSDKVNNAIHAYPLEKGIGNNPINQQEFIRQSPESAAASAS